MTPTAMKLAQVEILIDKMHLTGHTDEWCLANCDPKRFKELDEVRALTYLMYMLYIQY